MPRAWRLSAGWRRISRIESTAPLCNRPSSNKKNERHKGTKEHQGLSIIRLGAPSCLCGIFGFLVLPERSLRSLLKLAAFRRKHQLHKFFSDLWLEPFCVSLVNAHDVRNHFAILASRVDIYLSFARRRQ